MLARDGYLCQLRSCSGRLEADHIVPLERGAASLDLANGRRSVGAGILPRLKPRTAAVPRCPGAKQLGASA